MGLSLKERSRGSSTGSCGGCWGWQLVGTGRLVTWPECEVEPGPPPLLEVLEVPAEDWGLPQRTHAGMSWLEPGPWLCSPGSHSSMCPTFNGSKTGECRPFPYILLLSEEVKVLNFKYCQSFQGCCGFSQNPVPGCRPESYPGTSCHLSPESATRQRKHAEHLGCDETIIPCLQLLAGKALRHARPELGAFPQQWHRERRGSLLSRCPPASPAGAPGLRCWASGCTGFPTRALQTLTPRIF